MKLHFVGPWDLHRDLACVPANPKDAKVLLVESVAKSRALPFHKKKLTLVLSAMHHFAAELRAEGFDVAIVNAPTYVDGIAQHVKESGATEIVAMEPREWGLTRALDRAQEEDAFGVPMTRHDDGGEGGHFFLSRAQFEQWADGRKAFRMGDFYRAMRKRFGYLMTDEGKPEGGKWTYDADNRKHARGQTPPTFVGHAPDAVTKKIMARVATWRGAFGAVDDFRWAVTREQALADLDRFFDERAQKFGDYQDAMLVGEPTMWHALISTSLNLGLLLPREVCDRIEREYRDERMPLAAAEGLLRQVLGWREFIRGIYWLRMPELRTSNLLKATRPLPDFFWEPERTDLTCLRESIGQVKELGYAHHIQRLMVQGNFALLAGIAPLEISHWFWAAFVDAFEWVELPNVHGMAIYADDTFTTKPYAASGNYIHKMSDYCRSCRYDVKKKVGADACPFNSMFWAFMEKHRARFESNHRMKMLYRTWGKYDEETRAAILETAETFLATLKAPDDAWTFDDDAC